MKPSASSICAIVLAVGLWLVAPAIAQDEAPPAPQGPPIAHIKPRIDRLEQQVADLISKMRTVSDPAGQLALKADISLRLIAVNLLRAGQNDPAGGAVAVMYGHMIADEADAFAQLFGQIPPLVAEAQNPDAEVDTDRVILLSNAIEALKKFNAQAEDPSVTLASPQPAAVDAYLNRMLSPLAQVLSAMDGSQPQNTWLIVQSADGPRRGPDSLTLPSVTSEKIDALLQRIHRVVLPTKTKEELLVIVDYLRRGYAMPDLRPRVAEMYRLTSDAIDVGEAFEEAAWMGQALIDEFRDKLRTAIVLFKDPRTRSAGVERINDLSATLNLVRRMNELAKTEALIEHPRKLYIAAHKLRAEDPVAAGKVIDLLERLVDVLLTYHRMTPAALPPEIKRTEQLMRREYEFAQLQMLTSLDKLVDVPRDASDPQWLDGVEQLQLRIDDIGRLNMIPSLVDRMNLYRPRPTGGVYQRLRQVAVDMLDPALRANAVRTLQTLEHQFTQFAVLPIERELRAAEKSVVNATDNTHALLVEQIDRLRQKWATAWANGEDVEAAGKPLVLMRRLLNAVADVTVVYELDQAMTQLNRWAGWEVEAESIRPVMRVLPARLWQACKFAAIGNFTGLETALEQIEKETPLALLIARLTSRLGSVMTSLPDGPIGTLGQCLYPPNPSAFAADHRLELAQLCLYVVEIGYAREHDDVERMNQLIAHAGGRARAILNRMDGIHDPADTVEQILQRFRGGN